MTPLGLGLGLGLGRQGGGESPDMILVYAIPAPNTKIELAIQANSTWFGSGQAAVIDWGDGSAETVSATSGHTGYIGHTYAAAGTYTVRISGSMKQYGRSSAVDIAGQALLTHVHSFGKLGITSFFRAFYRCTGLLSVPKTMPDSVTDINSMFASCSGAAFNPDISAWNVSKVTNMGYMFYNCYGAAFNPDMKRWTLKTGVNTAGMFTSSKTQPPAWLDNLLVAWAANPKQGNNITIDFSPNKFTEDGGAPLPAVAAALQTLEGKGWIITTANPYSSTGG
jgi:surface protein